MYRYLISWAVVFSWIAVPYAAEMPKNLAHLPHACTPSDDWCFYSLKPMMEEFADWEHRDPHEQELMDFEDVETAIRLCESTHPMGRLARLDDHVKQETARSVVLELNEPHWLGAVNPSGNTVKWFHEHAMSPHSTSFDDFLESDTWEENYPWHELSGQPNDCDGAELPESCIFIGPDGKWFDFACGPKTKPLYSGEEVGPVIQWDEKDPESKRMYKIYPLCDIPGTQEFNYQQKEKQEL